MKKAICFLAVLLLLTGCANSDARADEKGKVSQEAAEPAAAPTANIDIGMYLYDDDWDAKAGALIELYAETTETGEAQPTYTAAADDSGKIELKAVAAGQNYTLQVKDRDGELEATGALRFVKDKAVSHKETEGYIEISVTDDTEKLFLTVAVTDDDKIRCSYASSEGYEKAD